MNSKKAKLLRRLAQAHTAGLPDRDPLVMSQHKRTFGRLQASERAITKPNEDKQ